MSDVTFKSQIGNGLLYSACARLNVQQLSAQIANMVPWAFQGECIIQRARGSHFFSYICMIRHFGAVWAWPDHHGCTGATHHVKVGVGTGVTFGMAVGVQTGIAGFGSGVTGATNCGVC